VLGMAGAVLAAPYVVPARAAGTTVRWAQWKTTEVGEKFMGELKAAFEKDTPGVELELVDSPFNGFHDKSVVLYQAKKLADVLLVQVDWVAEFADLGMLAPIDEWIAKEEKADPSFMAGIPSSFRTKWKGKQYYLPIESGVVALYWNTALFKAAGLPGAPKTWAEFNDYAKKLTIADKKQYAITGTLGIEPPTNATYDIYPMLLQAGAKLIDPATNRAAFNSPEGVKAVETYVERINTLKISVPGVLSNGEKEKRANFASGNVAMMFEGPWGVAIQKGLNPKLEYDVAVLPKGATTGSIVRGSLNTVTTQAQDKESAWKFVRWLSSPKGSEMWARGTGGYPSRLDVAKQDWFAEQKLFRGFAEQMTLPNAVSPFLVMPNAVEMNKIITTEVQNAVQGKKSAKQALDDAAAGWNKIFAAVK
jgi:ABC-type glycerol-3-phosphate transport system substrate-binding protein